MLREFKKFIMRGNVVDLAVAVVVGAAFSSVVSSFVSDLVTPLIAAIGGQPDFSNLTFTINESKFNYGNFINQLMSFLLVSGVIFFVVIQPLNQLQERAQKRKKPEDPTEKKCEFCLSEIPIEAKKCKYCTSKV